MYELYGDFVWNYYLFNQYVRKCDAYFIWKYRTKHLMFGVCIFFELVENILYDQLIFNIIFIQMYFDKNWNVINVKGLSRCLDQFCTLITIIKQHVN